MTPPIPAPTPRRATLAVGFGCLLALPATGQDIRLDDEESDKEALPGIEMLVDGSILKKILIPQYDEQRRLSSVLRADQMVLVNDRTIDAETVNIEFYHPDRSLKAGIALESARLLDQRLLRSTEPVTLESNDLAATGTGLVYELDRSRGFLQGPATARTLIDMRTSMNTPSLPGLRAGGIALIAAGALVAQEPETLSPTQLEGLNRLAAPNETAAAEAAEKSGEQLDKTAKLSEEADESLKDFLEKAAVEMEDRPTPDLTTKVPDPKLEAEFKRPASIEAKKGIFFDSESGILVFLEAVEIDHPEFTLTGADEVKVFMEKDEPAAAKPDGEKPEADQPDADQPDEENGGEAPDKEAPKEEDGLLGDAEFGDPTRIVATGTVVVERKRLKKGDKAAKASGRQMVMDLKTNELIIRGGQPWIISDTANGRVIDPNGYILINLKSGDASFVGDARGFVEIGKDN